MSDHETYSKLVEGLHIAGYTFERACSNLETLLEGDRRRLDGRFRDPDEFPRQPSAGSVPQFEI
jgi:hypothetical protein